MFEPLKFYCICLIFIYGVVYSLFLVICCMLNFRNIWYLFSHLVKVRRNIVRNWHNLFQDPTQDTGGNNSKLDTTEDIIIGSHAHTIFHVGGHQASLAITNSISTSLTIKNSISTSLTFTITNSTSTQPKQSHPENRPTKASLWHYQIVRKNILQLIAQIHGIKWLENNHLFEKIWRYCWKSFSL